METLCLIIDAVAMGLILYYSLKHERAKEGTPEEGFFRVADPAAQAPPARGPRDLNRRSFR